MHYSHVQTFHKIVLSIMNDKELRIQSEQTKRLYGQGPIGLLGTVINAVITASIIGRASDRTVVLSWVFAFIVLALIRFIDIRSYVKVAPTLKDHRPWRNRFVFLTFLSGVLWGSAALFTNGADTAPMAPYQVFLAFVQGGMSAAALGVYSAYLPAFLAFAIPTMCPIAVVFLIALEPFHIAMGAMTLLFLILMIFAARRHNGILVDRISLEMENETLIGTLKKEIDERTYAQATLEKNKAEIEERIAARTAELQTLNLQLSVEIGERKLIEVALWEKEEKYRDLVENINEVIYVLDETGCVTFVSPAVERVLGYRPDDFVGRKLTEFVYPVDVPVVNSGQTLLKSLDAEPLEYRMLAGDGAVRWVRSSERSIQKEGRPVGIRGLLADITETKKLETALNEAKKMEAIGRVAGGVAHDLNNILSGIVTYPEILLLDLPDGELREAITVIQQSGRRAADIVQDLLTLSRRGVSAKEVVNLNTVIKDYLLSNEFSVSSSRHPNVRIETRLDADLLNIQGSPLHLTKMLMNLVSNAFEAMPAGGVLTIETGNRYQDRAFSRHEKDKEGDYAVLLITDTGIGMSREVRERIFEPFFSRKAMGRSGTGLGMAVVWGTVTDHNGRIEVMSDEGEGTRFTVHFKATREELPQRSTPYLIDDYLGNGETILIVDDMPEQRDIGTKLLTKLGYSVAAVSSGEEAVAYIRMNAVDLLVLDMIMPPGMDGLETYRRIRDLRRDQKAVIASGFSETDRVKAAQQLGAGAYVKKPYTMETLGIAVRNELRAPVRS
jgi:PAS domain S-box-containing protein